MRLGVRLLESFNVVMLQEIFVFDWKKIKLSFHLNLLYIIIITGASEVLGAKYVFHISNGIQCFWQFE